MEGRLTGNLLALVPKAHQEMVSAAFRSIFALAEPDELRARYDEVTDTVQARFPKAAASLRDARRDVLAFAAFPREHWRKIWSNNPLERLNKEIPVLYLSMPQGSRRWLLRSVIVPRSDSKEILTPRFRWLSSV